MSFTGSSPRLKIGGGDFDGAAARQFSKHISLNSAAFSERHLSKSRRVNFVGHKLLRCDEYANYFLAGSKRHTHSPDVTSTHSSCVHMITARQLTMEVGVSPRLSPRAVFDSNKLSNFLWDYYDYQFESKWLHQYFVCGRRIFRHFQGEKRDQRLHLPANDKTIFSLFVNIGFTSLLWLWKLTSDWSTSIECFLLLLLGILSKIRHS